MGILYMTELEWKIHTITLILLLLHHMAFLNMLSFFYKWYVRIYVAMPRSREHPFTHTDIACDYVSNLITRESCHYSSLKKSHQHSYFKVSHAWDLTSEIKAVAIEMEDWMVPSTPYIFWPAFFSNTGLKAWRATNHDTHVHVPPLLWNSLEDCWK